MDDRLPIDKTYKLFINGKFPRSESGRSMAVADNTGRVVAHLSRASRKDLRDAVEAARGALAKWSGEAPGGATAFLRSQILYRIAEMMEGKRAELAEATERRSDAATKGADEVGVAIDRLVHYAGWCDKYQQVLGTNNPVAGPYYNFTTPEPTGVVAVVCPDDWPLLGMVSLLAPVICSGNTAVVLASESNPIPACIFAEACATGDLPPGVVNILTGTREELVGHIATHRGIDAVHAANVSPEHARILREGASENLKRVVVRDLPPGTGTGAGGWFDAQTCESAWWIEPFVEMKTVWHPSGA
ncbi:MAG: aldehyde dehydrogenase family protein [Phycisphaeraceae bacterium]|nr:aldehyde dehydrogenase family protein [Phycisphaeraceae bacterium]